MAGDEAQLRRARRDVEGARLALRYQAGDESAFAELYRWYFDDVVSFLRVFVRDETELEDLAQQVFLKVLDALPRYEQRGVAFGAWILRISRNTALDVLRRRRAVPTDPGVVVGLLEDRTARSHPPEDAGEDHQLSALVAALPRVERELVLLKYGCGMSNADIAEVLGRTTDAVYRINYRALSELERRLAAANHPKASAPRRRGARLQPVTAAA